MTRKQRETARWEQVSGIVIPGHGVASGQGGDPRFPGGTIRLQRPAFAQRGLDLDGFFPGTVNISIRPYHYRVRRARHTFTNVKWKPDAPPEDFSFFDCRLMLTGLTPAPEDWHRGLIYYPHPETKPEHFQDEATLELLLPPLAGIAYGLAVELAVDLSQLAIEAP